ncbi:hypothetical protein [Streptomyces natalensis]|uniref:Uncharacterized protein n=1 Tax=Streptomyces natalensis ATCC 27448 TaxID=1240678 RepID=A0A0D7CK28_9ACTN|nr:hypothetical protein [Streptomyces natalensis]KIZ15772.1 hypothetical protein SNA_20830 [Streptomyces natalensis ATCC 27448]
MAPIRATAALTVTAAAFSLTLTLATPAAATTHPSVPHAAQLAEDTVNCVDYNVNSNLIGDNLFVLTDLNPQETESTPPGTVDSVCTTSALSTEPATMTATFSNGTTKTATIQPGQSVTFRPPHGDIDDRIRGVLG